MCAFILPSKPTHLPRWTDTPQRGGSRAGNSYMVTNRVHPGWDFPIGELFEIRPLPEGGLSWYMSSVEADDREVANYRRQDRAVFQREIEAQLIGQQEPQITVFIHGLDSLWDSAVHDTAVFRKELRHHAGYEGLVIGFDWPSYGEIDSSLRYATSDVSFETSGSIRDNINGSVAAFRNLLQFLQELRDDVSKVRPGLRINLVCHSEGNYMAMLGLAGASSVTLDQIVLLAADIDNGAFQTPSDGDAGRAVDMVRVADRVTVYYSNNDSTLVGSQAVFQKYHNRSYGGRLGHTGPAYNQGRQHSKMCSVDCSMVVSDANPDIPASFPDGEKASLHCAYLVLPQVLRDIAATLSGTPASDIAHRTPTRNPNDFAMDRVKEA